MTLINDAVEQRVQHMLPRSSGIVVDGCIVYMLDYMNNYFIRYVDGSKHITADCRREYIDEHWSRSLPFVARMLFTPKEYIVELSSPVSWDNESDPIPDDTKKQILSRIQQAVCKKYSKCRIVITSSKAGQEM